MCYSPSLITTPSGRGPLMAVKLTGYKVSQRASRMEGKWRKDHKHQILLRDFSLTLAPTRFHYIALGLGYASQGCCNFLVARQTDQWDHCDSGRGSGERVSGAIGRHREGCHWKIWGPNVRSIQAHALPAELHRLTRRERRGSSTFCQGKKMGLRHWRFGGGAIRSDLQIRSRNFNILGQTLDDSGSPAPPTAQIIPRFGNTSES